jgi:hypothetical protein
LMVSLILILILIHRDQENSNFLLCGHPSTFCLLKVEYQQRVTTGRAPASSRSS